MICSSSFFFLVLGFFVLFFSFSFFCHPSLVVTIVSCLCALFFLSPMRASQVDGWKSKNLQLLHAGKPRRPVSTRGASRYEELAHGTDFITTPDLQRIFWLLIPFFLPRL